MTKNEAISIIMNFFKDDSPKEDEPVFEEASHFLIEEYGDMEAALDLGGYYYGKKMYDLAYKYYTMASKADIPFAWVDLGYIWYYGRTGERDYQKAYECFDKAVKILTGLSTKDKAFYDDNRKVNLDTREAYDGYINAVYKIADMYHSGHYVEKDFDRYAWLINHLMNLISDSDPWLVPDYHLPELELRQSEIILKTKNDKKAALDLLKDVKSRMEKRLYYDPFFGNFSIMKSIVLDIYQLQEFTADLMDFYDLYYVLEKPCTVTFQDKKKHVIHAEKEGASIAVSLDGKWYHTVDDMMRKGIIDDENIPHACVDCFDFVIEEEQS